MMSWSKELAAACQALPVAWDFNKQQRFPVQLTGHPNSPVQRGGVSPPTYVLCELGPGSQVAYPGWSSRFSVWSQ